MYGKGHEDMCWYCKYAARGVECARERQKNNKVPTNNQKDETDKSRRHASPGDGKVYMFTTNAR